MTMPYDPKQNGRNSPNWSRINQWLLWLGLAAAVAWMFYRHNAQRPRAAMGRYDRKYHANAAAHAATCGSP